MLILLNIMHCKGIYSAFIMHNTGGCKVLCFLMNIYRHVYNGL